MKNLVHIWHEDCRSLIHNETLAIIASNKERLFTYNSNRFSKFIILIWPNFDQLLLLLIQEEIFCYLSLVRKMECYPVFLPMFPTQWLPSRCILLIVFQTDKEKINHLYHGFCTLYLVSLNVFCTFLIKQRAPPPCIYSQ